jgi:hypothetical protein
MKFDAQGRLVSPAGTPAAIGSLDDGSDIDDIDDEDEDEGEGEESAITE